MTTNFKVEPDEKTSGQALLHPYPNELAFNLGAKAFKTGRSEVGQEKDEDFQREFQRGYNHAYLRAFKKARGIENSKKRLSTP